MARIATISIVAYLASRACLAQPKPETPEAIFTKLRKSVVVVISTTKEGTVTGSGVVIPGGKIVTNRHLVDGATLTFASQGSKSWTTKRVMIDPQRDLALIEIDELDLPPVKLGGGKAPQVGAKTFAIGAPRGLELTLSEGIVSSIRRDDQGYYIQTTAPISPGSSGGGLFDRNGVLIGITTFQVTEGQNLNFALPVSWVRELPKRAIPFVKPVATSPRPVLADDFVARASKVMDEHKWRDLASMSEGRLAVYPNDPSGWFYLGTAKGALGEPDEGIKALRRSIELGSADASTWNNLAVCYNQKEAWDEAINCAREGLKLEPDDAKLKNSLSNAYTGIGQREQSLENHFGAIEKFRDALRQNSNNASAWFGLGYSSAEVNDLRQAATAYEKVIAAQPGNAAALNNLCLVYLRQGRKEEASGLYLKVYALDPKAGRALSKWFQ